MMKVTKPAPNRIDVVLSGILDAKAMEAAMNDLIEKSHDVKDGKMLYTILDFEMPTMGAISAEIMRIPQLMPLMTKFNRCALLTDTAWLRSAAEMEGVLIPSLTIKSFPLDQKKTAESWLNDQDDDDVETENFPV